MLPLGNSVIFKRKGKHFFRTISFVKGPGVFTVIVIHMILFYFIVCVCHRQRCSRRSLISPDFQADMLFYKSSNMCFPQGIKSGM